MYIPRINSGLKSEVLCLHKLHQCRTVTSSRSISVNALNWVCNPIRSDSIVVNESFAASVIIALMLTFSANEPLHVF